MSDIFGICLLFFFAFSIIAAVSALSYVLIFKKYGDKVNKTAQNDVNKGKIRLKYCVNCGGDIDKNNRCKDCNTKF